MNHKRYKLANLLVRKRRKAKRVTGERRPLAAGRYINALGRIPPAKLAALHRERAGDARQSPKIN